MALKRNTEKLVKAVLANRFKEVTQIIEEDNFDAIVLDDVFKALNINDNYPVPPIPLYYISLCNQMYLTDDNWSEGFQHTVNRNLKGCKALIGYWEKLGYDVTTPIDFSRYSNLVAFYCTFDYESLLDGTEEQLIAMGYDKEEAELCYALVSYDQPTIFRLLEKGVNPDVWICRDWSPSYSAEQKDGCNGLNYVEYASFVDPQLYGFHSYYRSKPIERMPKPTLLMLHCVFMGAAYKQIYYKIESLGLVK